MMTAVWPTQPNLHVLLGQLLPGYCLGSTNLELGQTSASEMQHFEE